MICLACVEDLEGVSSTQTSILHDPTDWLLNCCPPELHIAVRFALPVTPAHRKRHTTLTITAQMDDITKKTRSQQGATSKPHTNCMQSRERSWQRLGLVVSRAVGDNVKKLYCLGKLRSFRIQFCNDSLPPPPIPSVHTARHPLSQPPALHCGKVSQKANWQQRLRSWCAAIDVSRHLSIISEKMTPPTFWKPYFDEVWTLFRREQCISCHKALCTVPPSTLSQYKLLSRIHHSICMWRQDIPTRENLLF